MGLPLASGTVAPLGRTGNFRYRLSMADEPENHTLRLLREMREESLRLHAETRGPLSLVLVEMAKTVNAAAET